MGESSNLALGAKKKYWRRRLCGFEELISFCVIIFRQETHHYRYSSTLHVIYAPPVVFTFEPKGDCKVRQERRIL